MTAENTACLNRAAELGEQHQRLEQGLVATQHSVLADAVSMKRKEAEERDKMVQVRGQFPLLESTNDKAFRGSILLSFRCWLCSRVTPR